MRKILTAFIPFIVLLLAWAAASRAVYFDSAISSLILVLPYVIAILALFMSIWYHNSSAFFLIAFVLLSHIIIAIAGTREAMLTEVLTLVSIFMPVNVIWLVFIKERGIISKYGANKAIIVGCEIVWIIISMLLKQGDTAVINPDSYGAVIPVKAPAIILYVIAVCILLANYLIKSHYMSLVFTAVLFSSFILLHFAHKPAILAIFTTAVFIMMVIALFEVSYSLAFYDTLTGILSRRALEQELLKLGSQYAIAMVDIDHFKKINDTYGHDIGDEVLKMIASIIDRLSGRAKAFRYGGEEFAIIFQGEGCTSVMETLERIRRAVEKRPFIIRSENRPAKKPNKIDGNSKGQGRFHVTVSIGVAHRTESLKVPGDVIRKADEALYKSKTNGRNRVSI